LSATNDKSGVPLLESIPPPTIIRARMAELMREQELLRSLLRTSEHKERLSREGHTRRPALGEVSGDAR
jgi:hypothetical protein